MLNGVMMARKKKKERKKKNTGEKKNTLKKEERKHNEQLKWVLIIIVLVFLSFIITYLYIQSLKKFDFAGVHWDEQKQGELLFYHSRMKIASNPDVFYNLPAAIVSIPFCLIFVC